jgi:hypothetical protein
VLLPQTSPYVRLDLDSYKRNSKHERCFQYGPYLDFPKVAKLPRDLTHTVPRMEVFVVGDQLKVGVWLLVPRPRGNFVREG